MRIFLMIIITFLTFQVQAQLENGTYRSNGKSFKENYILVVSDSAVTIYGWEQPWSERYKRTYFRSTTQWKENGGLTFERFIYSHQPYTLSTINNFVHDRTIEFPDALLNRYFFQFKKINKNMMECISVKDMYNSRADTFFFEKID